MRTEDKLKELKLKNWPEIWEYEASGAHAVDLEWQPVFSQGKVLFLPMDASQLIQTWHSNYLITRNNASFCGLGIIVLCPWANWRRCQCTCSFAGALLASLGCLFCYECNEHPKFFFELLMLLSIGVRILIHLLTWGGRHEASPKLFGQLGAMHPLLQNLRPPCRLKQDGELMGSCCRRRNRLCAFVESCQQHSSMNLV